MTISQLKYILTIANYGSFTEASKKLFISQPSLSSTVKDLEDELGITVFERTKKGIIITKDGSEFISYARQIISQVDSLELRYSKKNNIVKIFSVSSQHYDFVAQAFVKLIKNQPLENFRYSIKETRTYEIIEDVKKLNSELGILILNNMDAKFMQIIFKDNNLKFKPLFITKPHVFLGKHHPLWGIKQVTLNDILDFPYITYTQGETHTLHFAEELFEYFHHSKNIIINDRATLMNLLLETNSCTIGTGIMTSPLNNGEIGAIPIKSNREYTVGLILRNDFELSDTGKEFIDILKSMGDNFYT